MIIRPYSRGQCPHCLTTVRFESTQVLILQSSAERGFPGNPWVYLGGGQDALRVHFVYCPNLYCPNLACGRPAVSIEVGQMVDGHPEFAAEGMGFCAWPLQGTERPVPQGVPEPIAQDYREAGLVLHLSPKASAALSRRALQSVLREMGFPQRDLFDQIEAALPSLPSYIRQNIDAIRNVGNFGAHPMKDRDSGAIIDVEQGEAEWNLGVLQEILNYYYVQEPEERRKREVLNKKLKSVGKPPMRSS